MQINHLTLVVDDVLASAQFLETNFGLRRMEGGTAAMTGLWDDDAFVLVLMRSARGEPVTYPDGFHLGFLQPSDADVDAIYRRLAAGGFDVPAPRRLHGSWAFYFQAPGGFVIEVSH